MLVALNHVLGAPSGGFVGVDAFFVISGFIITSVLLREYSREKSISFGNFYTRRLKRILPAALLVILVTVLASSILLSFDRAREIAFDGFWAFAFGANWNMLLTGVDYFAEGLPPSPLQHYWSLSIEEQFYFIWPLLMLLVLLRATRLKRDGSSYRNLLMTIGCIVAGSLAWSIYETANSPGAAYFNSFSRFWELGVGAMLAVVATRMRALPIFVAVPAAYLGLLMIGLASFLYTEETPFPGTAALLPVAGTGLIMLAGVKQSSTYNRAMSPLTNPVSKYIGDISYSLYLWHFPLTVLLLNLIPEGTTYYVATLAGTFIFSAISYHFVENPIRRSSWLEESRDRRDQRRTLVTMTAVTTVALGLLGGTSYVLHSKGTAAFDAYVQTAQAEVDAREASLNGQVDEASAAALRCMGAGYLEPANQPCDLRGMPLTPAVGKLASDVGTAEDLACRRADSPETVTCTFGSQATDALKVALIGDSHAGVYLPVLREIAAENNWSLTTYIGNGCQWALRSQDECGKQLDAAQSDFTDDTPYDLIISAAARKYTSTWSTSAVGSAAARAADAASVGTKVVYLEDVPMPSEESLRCLERVDFDPATSTCGTPAGEALQQPDQIAAALSDVEGISVISVNDLLCLENFCPSVIGNVITYRDTVGHLTVAYAKSMKPALTERLQAVLNT